MKKPNGYWKYDTCYEEAKKYFSRNEFLKNSNRAYNVARKTNGLMITFGLGTLI